MNKYIRLRPVNDKVPFLLLAPGFIKKPTVSEISSARNPSSPHQDLLTLACSITGFYPPGIAVKWLKRCNDQETEVKKEEGLAEVWGPVQTQPRSFRATAVLAEAENGLEDVDKDAEIVCRVEHCSLLEPVERVWTKSRVGKAAGLWRKKHESDMRLRYQTPGSSEIRMETHRYWLTSAITLYHILQKQ